MKNTMGIDYKEVEIFVSQIDRGRVTILRGGFSSDDPVTYMDEVVSDYVQNKLHNQFIEIHMDTPQVRVIIEGINELPYISYEEYKQKRK